MIPAATGEGPSGSAAAVHQLASMTHPAGKGDWLGWSDNQLMWEGPRLPGSLVHATLVITKFVLSLLIKRGSARLDWK